MKTMLTLAAAALLTLGLSAQTCECAGNACQAKPAPAAQTCPKKDAEAKPERPAKQKRQHARKCAEKGTKGPRAQKDAQGPRGPKARPNRGAPEGKGPADWKEMPPAERAKALRARAAELEKRAAELEAKAAQTPAAE